jgi:hypothetical protein
MVPEWTALSRDRDVVVCKMNSKFWGFDVVFYLLYVVRRTRFMMYERAHSCSLFATGKVHKRKNRHLPDLTSSTVRRTTLQDVLYHTARVRTVPFILQYIYIGI